jgi:hypothetical protein
MDVWSRRVEAQAHNRPEHVMLLRKHISSGKRAWRSNGRNSESEPSPFAQYAEAMKELYAAITDVTGAGVIVDTSKRPREAAAVELAKDIDLYILHLVRDPRGVIYSRQRSREQRLLGNRHPSPQLARHRKMLLGYDLMFWNVMNLEAERVSRRRHASRRLFLTYEELVSNPCSVLTRICTALQEPSEELPFSDEHTAVFGVNHVVHGNNNRTESGAVTIRPDQAWKKELTADEKLMAQLLTFPLMRRYGYR